MIKHFIRDSAKIHLVRDTFFEFRDILNRISFNVRKYFLIKDAQWETLINLWNREV